MQSHVGSESILHASSQCYEAIASTPAVRTDGEFVVDMIALSGDNLGQLKVCITTTLMEVRVPLIAATGGGVNQFEIHLLHANGEFFDKAASTPFANANAS